MSLSSYHESNSLYRRDQAWQSAPCSVNWTTQTNLQRKHHVHYVSSSPSTRTYHHHHHHHHHQLTHTIIIITSLIHSKSTHKWRTVQQNRSTWNKQLDVDKEVFQGDHSHDNVKFPDGSRQSRHVTCYSYHACTSVIVSGDRNAMVRDPAVLSVTHIMPVPVSSSVLIRMQRCVILPC